jgi:hypothetical protein
LFLSIFAEKSLDMIFAPGIRHIWQLCQT